MKMGKLACLLLVAPLLSGCAGFWDAPSSSSSTSFTLTNSGNLTIAPGSTGTSTIKVTPGSSFTGTVALTCSVTTTPTSATSPATCGLSTSSLTFSTTTAQSSTLTVSTSSTTTTGAYDFSVTGTSGSVSETTTLCAQVTSTSGTCTSTSGTSSSAFYVLNQTTKQIAAYAITSGVLKQISGSPYTLSYAPYSIAIAPNGNFLYVGTEAGIYLYTIGSNGALTLANSSNVITQDVATTMQVDSTNSWLLEAGTNAAELFAIPINSSTGVLSSSTERYTILPAATVKQLAISPDNTHVFVALGNSGTENVTFSAASSTPFGTISNIAAYNTAGGAVSVAVDPSSRLVYIGETSATSGSNSGGLRVLNYSTLADVTGSPFATGGIAPYAIVPTAYGSNSGNYVYVANRTVSASSTGNIVGFSVTTSGGVYTLSALGTSVATGITPLSLVQDSTGNYMLVVNSGGTPDLGAYTFDSSTAGKLNLALSSSTGTDPTGAYAIATAP